MPRDANIPIFLWVATAALVHILYGGGAHQAAAVLEERDELRAFGAAVRANAAQSNAPLDVLLLSEEDLPPELKRKKQKPRQPTRDADSPSEEREQDGADKPRSQRRPKPAKKTKTEVATAPKPKVVTPKQVEPKKQVKSLPAPSPNRRISVVQDQTKDQEPNPDAEFLSDQNRRVKEQTRARLSNRERHDKDPSLSTPYRGPSTAAGDAHVTDVAHARDEKGNQANEPGSEIKGAETQEESRGARAQLRSNKAVFSEQVNRAQVKGTPIPRSQVRTKARSAQEAQAEQTAQPKSLTADNSWFLAPKERESRQAQKRRAARAEQVARGGKTNGLPNLRKFGALDKTPGGLDPNLNPMSALDAIGGDQLRRERLADGARRRSAHQGSWVGAGLNKWRSAIENYVPTVKPGNQTALNTARSPFARYLNHIHNRLHPVFAHRFLGTLDALPREHALNRFGMRTDLEIILSKEEGRVLQMGVTRASGATAFDVGALESVKRAGPFGTPPAEIVSPDGKVYLHWEFHRDPKYACSTYFARPFILRTSPVPAPLPKPPRHVPEEHGALAPPGPPPPTTQSASSQ